MIKSIILASLIAIIYNFLVYKLTDIMVSDVSSENKQDTSIIIILIIGIVTLIVAQTLFKNNVTFGNELIKYGLTFGSIILLTYTFAINWNTMIDRTKLLIIAIIFSVIIWLCYYYYKENDKKK